MQENIEFEHLSYFKSWPNNPLITPPYPLTPNSAHDPLFYAGFWKTKPKLNFVSSDKVLVKIIMTNDKNFNTIFREATLPGILEKPEI